MQTKSIYLQQGWFELTMNQSIVCGLFWLQVCIYTWVQASYEIGLAFLKKTIDWMILQKVLF